MSQLNSSLPAWGAVAAHAKDFAKVHVRDLSASDPKRWQNLHVEHDGWLHCAPILRAVPPFKPK
jgi:hypothetical protein